MITVGKGYYKVTYSWFTALRSLYCQCCGNRVFKGEKILKQKTRMICRRYCEECGKPKWKEIKDEHAKSMD